jgi:hypothetical protein
MERKPILAILMASAVLAAVAVGVPAIRTLAVR